MRKLTDEFKTKLDALVHRLEAEHFDRFERDAKILNDSAIARGRRAYQEFGYDDIGNRFMRVWNETPQRCVSLFVEIDTGKIFGASGWKKYNPVHEYGTLDTIDEWDWSEYHPRHKEGKSSLVPKALRS